jgi:hypothetical protein
MPSSKTEQGRTVFLPLGGSDVVTAVSVATANGIRRVPIDPPTTVGPEKPLVIIITDEPWHEPNTT